MHLRLGCSKDVDGLDKPGHDELENALNPFLPFAAVICAHLLCRHSGARSCASPESITPTGVWIPGLRRAAHPRCAIAHRGMTRRDMCKSNRFFAGRGSAAGLDPRVGALGSVLRHCPQTPRRMGLAVRLPESHDARVGLTFASIRSMRHLRGSARPDAGTECLLIEVKRTRTLREIVVWD